MATSHAPGSPHHAAINGIIISLGNEYHLPGIIPRNGSWTPSESAKTDSERCVDFIKYLYWSARPALHRRLEQFRDQAALHSHGHDRLRLLIRILEEEVGLRKMKGSAMPFDRDHQKKRLRPTDRPLPQPDFGRVAHAGPMTESLVPNGAASNGAASNDSADSYHTSRCFRPETNTGDATSIGNPNADMPDYPDADGPYQSATEDENEDYGTPPESPTLPYSSGLTEWRNDLSESMSNRSASRKRASDNMTSDVSRSKMPRTPSGPGTVSFGSTIPSINTSFGSTLPSHAVSFARESTTCTSFTSDIADTDAIYPRLPQLPRDDVTSATGPGSPRSSVDESPPEHFQVRDLPRQHLFVQDVPSSLTSAPFVTRYECCRLALDNGLEPSDVVPSAIDPSSSVEKLWKQFLASKQGLKPPARSLPKAYAAAAAGYQNVTLRGSLTFNQTNRGPLFQLKLLPLTLEMSCRFQREFRGDRFLYLDVPALTRSLPSHLSSQQVNIRRRYREWLCRAKHFLGRIWRVVLIEDKKRKGRTGEPGGQQVVLFAEEGRDLPRVRLDDLLNWFMPMQRNAQQSFCKAYARLELGFSKTTPTCTFLPSQIDFIADRYADGTPEDDRFHDPTLPWNDSFDTTTVMNDGCNLISLGAAQEIWMKLARPGPIPSVFQARIGGAKGIWIRSASTDCDDAFHKEKWILVGESQRKFLPRVEDLQDDSYNPNRTTFEVITFSSSLTASSLHVAFFPILQDRGVPDRVLYGVLRKYIAFEREQICDVVQDPIKLRQWVHNENSRQTLADGLFPWQAGMPLQLAQKIVLLLESGFTPTRLPYLADLVHRFVAQHLIDLRTNLRVPVGRSTMVLGISDPLGVLEPGEIHLAFSQTFHDPESNEAYPFLDNKETLVARHPALRRSDIQKVRAVFKPELSFILDVVVFPCKGRFPLAAKLQGGDYDGDRFWLCWEPALVKPFKNAPAPRDSDVPPPEHFGIQVDRRKLGQFTVDEFLAESFKFRCRPSFLGLATTACENLAYAQNSISTEQVEALAGLHGYLIDSSKNGFVFGERSYQKFLTSVANAQQRKTTPAFKLAMKKDQDLKRSRSRGTPPAKGLTVPHNKRHIIDFAYFHIVVPDTEDILKRLSNIFSSNQPWDTDLQGPLIFEQSSGDVTIQTELQRLSSSLTGIRREWGQHLGKKGNFDNPDDYNQCVSRCFERYSSLKPTNVAHAVVGRWDQQIIPGAFTQWALLKAGLLFSLFYEKQLTFVFQMAGRELAYLKARSTSGVNGRLITPVMREALKPKKVKIATPDDIPPSEISSVAFEEDLFDEEDFLDLGPYFEYPR